MSKKYVQTEEIKYKFSEYVMDIEVEQEVPLVTIICLTPENWNTDKLQTVTVKGILADESQQAIYINPVEKTENLEAIGDCDIYAVQQGEDSITFTCETIPGINIEFYVEWEDVEYIIPGEVLGKFYIENELFDFSFGMTLIDWCASEFNTQGYWINEYGLWNADLSRVNHSLHSGTSILLNNSMSFNLEPSSFIPIATVFEFYIEDTKYHAEESMTWRSWTASKYNTTKYYDSTNGNNNPIYEVAEDMYSVEKVRNCITGNTILFSVEVAPDDPITSITYTLNKSAVLPTIKTFVINSQTYNYMVGMNLELWCNSKFNTDEYYLNENGLWSSTGLIYNKNYSINNNIAITEGLNISLTNYIDDANTGFFYINETSFEYPINIDWEEYITINNAFSLNGIYIKYNNQFVTYKVINNIAEYVAKTDIIQNGYAYVLK